MPWQRAQSPTAWQLAAHKHPCGGHPREAPGKGSGAHVQGQLCVPHLLPLALVVLRYPSVELCVGLLQLQRREAMCLGRFKWREPSHQGSLTRPQGGQSPQAKSNVWRALGWQTGEGPRDRGGTGPHLPAASLVLLGQLLHGFSGPVGTKRRQGLLRATCGEDVSHTHRLPASLKGQVLGVGLCDPSCPENPGSLKASLSDAVAVCPPHTHTHL